MNYHTKEEYINKNLSAIARNTKTSIDDVINFYENTLEKLDNKCKALVKTHNYFKRETYWERKREMEKW